MNSIIYIVPLYIYMYVYMYICVCVCRYIYMYTYIFLRCGQHYSKVDERSSLELGSYGFEF
jgi:hypothetical protein